MRRGILYITWGTGCQTVLDRSVASVRRVYPSMPVHVVRAPEEAGGKSLLHKTRMFSLTPFESTLFLDADTIMLGNVDFGFQQAERFGVAACINECPWAARFGAEARHRLEYNTGVIFFSKNGANVMAPWAALAADTPARSSWTTLSNIPRGLPFEDQASFARAVEQSGVAPYVLPVNYNFRPMFHGSLFAPLKIWHDYRDLPPGLEAINGACERGERPITHIVLRGDTMTTPDWEK